MSARTEDAFAAVLLTQRRKRAEVPPLKPSEYWRVINVVSRPGSLLGATQQDVDIALRELGVADRVRALVSDQAELLAELDRLEASGIVPVASTDPSYPSALLSLGASAPPLLYVAGPPALLSRDLLGVVGSRDVTGDGAVVARAAAAEAVRHGVGVVSGGAKGVDRLAMQAALDAGGFVAGILADSLERNLRDAEVRSALEHSSLTLATPYWPSASFSVGAAMGRNKLIYALSLATLVVAADDGKGGTWAGANEAIRKERASVFIWAGPGAGVGNERLVELGGRPLRDIDALFPLPPRKPTNTGTGDQLTLDV